MRWITLLGRTGTVILMVGLALVLFSLISSATEYTPGFREPISPEEYQIVHSGVYTPQTGFQISVESTDNVHVYLLGVSLLEFDNWKTRLAEAYPDLAWIWGDPLVMPMIFVREAYPDLDAPQMPDITDLDDRQIPDIMDIMWNIAVLDKGLQTHPEIILWESPSSTTLSHEFISTDELYITVMVANPSSHTVQVETKITDLTALARKQRVIVAARLLIPIGVALAIPWLISSKVRKGTLRQRNSS